MARNVSILEINVQIIKFIMAAFASALQALTFRDQCAGVAPQTAQAVLPMLAYNVVLAATSSMVFAHFAPQTA
jgi:hypothetical protein